MKMKAQFFLALFLVLPAAACSSSSSPSIDAPTTHADAAVSPAVDSAATDAHPAVDYPPPPSGAGPVVYVGGFRPEIDLFRLDMATAKLTQVAVVPNPPM